MYNSTHLLSFLSEHITFFGGEGGVRIHEYVIMIEPSLQMVEMTYYRYVYILEILIIVVTHPRRILIGTSGKTIFRIKSDIPCSPLVLKPSIVSIEMNYFLCKLNQSKNHLQLNYGLLLFAHSELMG